MRTYVVQQGDSPARIASRPDMASCPKCAVDLVMANPQKESVRYPNGFVTFKSLHVGEVLNVPEKWSNGTLDALPKEYFDNLPSMPQVSGWASDPKIGRYYLDGNGRAFLQNKNVWGTYKTISSVPRGGVSGCYDACAYVCWTDPGTGQSICENVCAEYCPENVAGFKRVTEGVGSPPQGLGATTCETWTYGATVTIGQTLFQVLNQHVPVEVMQRAATMQMSASGATAMVHGYLYFFKPVIQPSVTGVYWNQIQIYFCSRKLSQVSRPVHIAYPLGLQGPPPVGAIATPAPGGPPQALPFTFQPQESYKLTVWGIPQSGHPAPDPTAVLQASGFQVLNIAQNSNLSYTANVVFVGSTALAIDPANGLETLVFENAGPAVTPGFWPAATLANPPISVNGSTIEIGLPAGARWTAATSFFAAYPNVQLPPGIQIGVPADPTGPVTVNLSSGANTITGVIATANGQLMAMSIVVTSVGAHVGTYFQFGETVVSDNYNVSSQVVFEYDYPNSGGPSYDGVLTLVNATGLLPAGDTIRGQTSGTVATVKYQYTSVLSTSAGLLGVTEASDQGTTLNMPYNAQPGDKVDLTVRPMLNTQGDISDPTSILLSYGFTAADLHVGVQNADCSWPITAINNSASAIIIDSQMMEAISGDSMWVTGLTANGNVVTTPPAAPAQIGGPIMRSCHAFTFTYVPNYCPAITGGAFDPSHGLSQLGFTNFTPPTTGPDELGQYTIDGVWEQGDGFQLPTSNHLTITGFTDNGPATNVPTGTCATSLPYTIQPGDTVNLIVRPIAVPGQPMSNPIAVLQSLGFENIAPAATYSDCTWSITATYTGNATKIPGHPQPPALQVTDPMVSPSIGAMWIVGMSVNSTTIKDANWAQLSEIPIDLQQCNAYSVLFTFDVCPALQGAPGSWDPTSAVQALLPNFKVAPGPNEYGQWTASGVWTGASVTGLSGSGGIHFTLLIDYGASQGCTVTPPACPAGQIADTVTKACVTSCSDGSAPANGVCPPPVKATGPCPTAGQVRDTQTGACVAACPGGGAPTNGVCPVVAPAAPTSTATTAVAVGAAVIILGGVAYVALT